MGERMNKVFEKILERFDEECISPIYYPGYAIDLEKANEIVKEVAEEYKGGWIPVSERLPEPDEYILVSFSNYSLPDIGRYENDADGNGAFYPGDDDRSYSSINIFVNAWMPLPECWKGENNG